MKKYTTKENDEKWACEPINYQDQIRTGQSIQTSGKMGKPQDTEDVIGKPESYLKAYMLYEMITSVDRKEGIRILELNLKKLNK